MKRGSARLWPAKRRPRASDREIAELVFGMKPGSWTVLVEDATAPGFGLAQFKPEGGAYFSARDKRWTFIPPKEQA